MRVELKNSVVYTGKTLLCVGALLVLVFGTLRTFAQQSDAPPNDEKKLDEVRPRQRDSSWAWPKEPMNSKTQKVLEAWSEAYKNAETLQYTETINYLRTAHLEKPLQVTLRFWGKRPNLSRVEVSVEGENESAVMVCDGKTIWEYDKKRNLYMKTLQPDGSLMLQGELGVLVHVVGPSLMFLPDPYISLTRGATSLEVVRTEQPKEVLVRRTQKGRKTLTWLNREDMLPRRYSVFDEDDGEYQEIVREKRTGLKLNEPIANSFFAFKLPAGAKLYVPPRPENYLLKPGTEVPNVAFLNSSGESVRLSKWKGKPYLLTFWAEWLPNSTKQLKTITKALNESRDENHEVTVLAVNTWDEVDALTRYQKEHEDSPLVLLRDPTQVHEYSIAYRNFGVRGLPTTYLVGKEGRVLKAWVGFDEEHTKEIKEAIEALSSL